MPTVTTLTLLTRLGLNIDTVGLNPRSVREPCANIRGAAEETVPRPLRERAPERDSPRIRDDAGVHHPQRNRRAEKLLLDGA